MNSDFIKIVQFNVENLFIFIDRFKNQQIKKLTEAEWQSLSTSIIPNKPLIKVLSLAKSIEEMQADIVMLCEVGGLESLVNFNTHFLGDQFIPLLIEGNSERGIDIGYLVRKSLPFDYDLRSHRARSVNKVHKFSRDVLELRVFHKENVQPFFILLLTHLKSKWDREGMDPDGRERRRAELQTLVQIYCEINSEFGEKIPILMGGDFNGRATLAETDEEFSDLYLKTDLRDCLEVSAIPESERYTQIQFTPTGKAKPEQLDYIFIPKLIEPWLVKAKTGVFRFKDELGAPYGRPTSVQMKRELPSDHYPVMVTLKPTL